MEKFTVKYQAGSYEGEITVYADDSKKAISRVKSWIRKQMTLPMYYESYLIK